MVSDASFMMMVLGALTVALVLGHLVRTRAQTGGVLARLGTLAMVAAVGAVALVLTGYLSYLLAERGQVPHAVAYTVIVAGLLGLMASLLVLLASLVMTVAPARPVGAATMNMGRASRVVMASLTLARRVACILLVHLTRVFATRFRVQNMLFDEEAKNVLPRVNLDTGNFDEEVGPRGHWFERPDKWRSG